VNSDTPRPAAELRRVVAPDGLLRVAVPTAAHLGELREAAPLLGIEPDKERRVLARLAGAFCLTGREALEYALDLGRGEAGDLIGMLPGPRRDRAGRGAAPVGPLRTTVGVTLLSLAPV
jgi:23S rRNA (guanine745-N1)-methyltransferase